MHRRNFGRRGGFRWNRDDSRRESRETEYEKHASGSSSRDRSADRSQGRGKGRGHPPWLRGKEIGLYYRDLHKTRRKSEEKIRVKLRIKLDPFCRDKILSVLRAAERKWGSPTKRGLYSLKYEKPEKEVKLEHKYQHIGESQFKEQFLRSVTGTMESNLEHSLSEALPLSQRRDPGLDEHLKLELETRQANGGALQEFRRTLPTYKKRNEILDTIEANQVVLLSGETGCGKTTQVAQFILDAEIAAGRGSMCHVVNTQPRRISAISVAQRVAEERGVSCGGPGSSCGYQIRLEKSLPRPTGSILFCTTGILLQWMQSDAALSNISHIVLDEVHERDTVTDFVMTILKDILPRRPDLKLVLMSATLNAESFSVYFNNCPLIQIPGFTYPVEELYLEDVLEITGFHNDMIKERSHHFSKYIPKYKRRQIEEDYEMWIGPHIRNLESTGKYSRKVLEMLRKPECEEMNVQLICCLVHHICSKKPDGAILVFLPGWDNISALNRHMKESGMFPPHRHRIIPLHSLMPTVMQKSVFERPPPGMRKIIISTNIAETSITIDDVVYVVDSGKIKMKNFDIDKNLTTLQPEWVSLANARQRRGRAGRVQPGICYHLYTRAREMKLEAYPLPEMQRSRLEEVILQLKILQLGRAADVLARVMDPPDPRAVELSLQMLHTLRALDADENLTPLGFHLAKLPLDPQTGKMILMAAIFGCVDPIFSIAASLSFKDAFVIPLGMEREVDAVKVEFAGGSCSDHIVLAEAVRRWEEAGSQKADFCHQYFLSGNTLTLLKDMKKQFAQHLFEMNFLSSADPKNYEANINSKNRSLIKAIICSGLYPHVAIVRKVKKIKRNQEVRLILDTPEDGRVKLHPKSVNNRSQEFPSPLLIYHQKIRSTAVFLHDTTMVTPLAVLFFGRGIVFEEFESGDGEVVMPGDLRFACYREVADIIQRLRDSLDQLLAHKVSHPGPIDWSHKSCEGALLSAIMGVLSYEDSELSTFAEEVDNEDSDDDD